MKWSAGWGSACDPCARAKTRCIRNGPDDAKCTRCQSLNASCAQQIRKPRKRRRRQTSAVSIHVSGPENLPIDSPDVTLTQSREPPSPADAATTITNEDPHNVTAKLQPNAYVAQVKAERTGVFSVPTWLPGFHPFPIPTCTCLGESEGKHVPEVVQSDEALLSIYRTRLSPQFPFVVIPDGLTASELQRSRPFLAKAVKMVASLQNRRSMWNQSKLLLRHISDSVFMHPDRSLDLLQAIVVFLGFYHYFCFAHGHFNSLTHLASSMIADMRLDRPRAALPPRKKYPQGIDPEEPRAMSNDERRAILAVWYINSCSAVAYKKVNSPGRHFTEHMERQLQDLQECPEFETDDILVQLICAQRMNEMAAQFQLSDQSVDVRPSSNFWTVNLDNLLSNSNKQQSLDKTHRCLVSSHCNFALLQLLEPQLVGVGRFQNDEVVDALRHTPNYFHPASGSKKEAADTALRAWLEYWLTIPVCHFFYMPMPGYLQLTDVIVILLRRARLLLVARYRLEDSHFSEVNMNNNRAPSSADTGSSSDDLMLGLLDRLASRFEEARIEMAAAHCSEWANDLFGLIAWKLRERIACIEKWISIISKEKFVNTLNAEAESSLKHGELGLGDGSDLAAFQYANESILGLDSLEQFLMDGNGGAFESWL
ncbi:hypothetical protein B0I35DRAFT_459447 [Stachybotrys elegans]|uniref:Zn(2)-C6 fungal-type domain-containing protein n=1 Tax=Stachybotrys elegans TaxID=80388 RepID=A0A8K0WRX3_9HYPO|nr:hypothetical protein B0I35DRAFT_459447 [Stachybotrys elegans]